ncbi:PR domain zinc finger protein 13 [Crotalus adamanteus]|uniref:PR domain zinc finger protein 13 n=1 Tax=Crotalus adamanteus TaxID=8729 RepID=A0AAW1CAT3_CROAD
MLSSRPPPALGITAESSVPAGLRLGPVPGTFKLGKYLSDRREPGPKKKVLLPHLGGKRRGRPRSPDGLKGSRSLRGVGWGGETARKKPYFTSLVPPAEGERQGRV